ncbi:unnamed protein product, partial [Gongylonema pulchrum]|uniref:t-SNARE coiled-coil homology domain-containing protein n=1 Tax=Gongylonema pulchrum TaxID=637853 RepID=A0A183DZC0_9BILA
MAESSPDEVGGGVFLSDGIMGLIQPAVEQEQQAPYDLDSYVRKLDDSKRRIAAIGNSLQNVHDRL